MIQIAKTSDLLKLPEQLYGTIKRVGILNKKPILYGDVNLLNPNDLYYINGAKLIYRYIKSSIEGSSITYYFDTIKSMVTDNLSVPEEERGKIRNAGYLFNEIIYSGDPNLVENGQLFYHDTLPYISIISNVDGTINLSTKEINGEGEITTVVTEYRVSPLLQHDYSKDYLTFEALESGTFTLTIERAIIGDGTGADITSFSYSIDNGDTWVTQEVNSNAGGTITTPSITAGNKVLLKGVATRYAHAHGPLVKSNFSSTGNFNISGNIMSLLYGDNFDGEVSLPTNSNNTFYCLFLNNTKLISAENLVLSATTLRQDCYHYMFYGCTALTTAPSILPATTLASNCYSGMFSGCTSLTTAPILSATTLADHCYSSMFYNCTALTTAPTLPAITLINYCYSDMFQGCTNLQYIKMMATDISASNSLYNWVLNVAANGTFVKNVEAQWNQQENGIIPYGWTVETADPEPSDEITI